MRRVVMVVVAVMGAVGFSALGATLAGASTRDVAYVTNVVASARSLQVGDMFTVTGAGQDKGSNEYELTFIADWDALHLADGGMVCEGTTLGSPSPDTPACEFDDATTTKKTTTHIYGTFGVTAATPKSFRITVCAASFSNPPDPFPQYPNTRGGSCKSRIFTVG
jgi:hypothetical protein